MQSPIHLTIVMEEAEVEKLAKLDSQGVLLHVCYREHRLQGVMASQELIDQELQKMGKKTSAVEAAVSPQVRVQIAMYIWKRQYASLLH